MAAGDNCSLLLSPWAIYLGQFSKVKVCDHLRKLLNLPSPIIIYSNLSSLLTGYISDHRELEIPLAHTQHFAPSTSIAETNCIEIIGRHARFLSPHLKCGYINPISGPTVRVTNLKEDFQTENQPADYNSPHVITSGRVCTTCTGFYTMENYEKHEC